MSARPLAWIEVVAGLVFCLATVFTMGITGPAGAVLLFAGRGTLIELRGLSRLAWIPVVFAFVWGVTVWMLLVVDIARNTMHGYTSGNSLAAAAELLAGGLLLAGVACGVDAWARRARVVDEPPFKAEPRPRRI